MKVDKNITVKQKIRIKAIEDWASETQSFKTKKTCGANPTANELADAFVLVPDEEYSYAKERKGKMIAYMLQRGLSEEHELTKSALRELEEELERDGMRLVDYKSEKKDTCSDTVSDPEDCLPMGEISPDYASKNVSELRDRMGNTPLNQ